MPGPWPRICLLALIWESSFLWIKLADQGFSPVEATLARLALGADVLWTVVLALAVRHQKTVTSWQAARLIVGFSWAVLIFTPWSAAAGLTSAGGLECLAASISYAISYIYMDKFLGRRASAPSSCRPASSLPPPSCSPSP